MATIKSKAAAKKTKAEEVEDDPKPTKAKKAKTPADLDRKAQDMLDLVSELDKVAGVTAVTIGDEGRMHTGLLCMDLMLGGGIAPNMYIFVGPEQSAKTTLSITMMAASVDQRVDLRAHWDAEGSTSSSMSYVANIFQTVGVKNADAETVFGIRDEKGWVAPPIVHLKDDNEGKKFFDWLYALQKRLPDKRFSDGRWWYVFDDSKDPTKVKARIAAMDMTVDTVMSSKNTGLWVPAKDGRLQAIILLDSWPALLPPTMDDDEGDNSIAVQARFFSKEILRVKGSFRSKRIALLSVNQLRKNPMARFGNPETEPGGEAIKYYSDCRLRLWPNALSTAPYSPKPSDIEDKKFLEQEPSVTGEGFDFYRYIKVNTIKNKLSIPNRKTWLRLWVEDCNGEARGFDPVFDLFHYLIETGQASGDRKKGIWLHLDGIDAATKALKWIEFKTLVLGEKEAVKEIFERIGMKPVNLRKGCMNQLRRGEGERLFVEQVRERMTSGRKTKDEETD